MKIQPHPLDRPGIVKILLGREASEALAATGEHHLVLTTKPDSTCPPGSDGRLVLLALPLDLETARAAESVALGRARAVRIKASPATPDQPRRSTANPDAKDGVSGGDSPVK